MGLLENVFSLSDACNGFWQIPLTKSCAKITTFITPFGRFYFNRLPFGINSGPEHFQRRMKKILLGLEGIINLADDILVYGSNKEELDRRLKAVLRKLREHGFTLNKSKCQFVKSSVKFLGHVIEAGNIKPDPLKTSAITKLNRPTNVSEARKFLGMINYLMKFIPNLSDKTKPIRELLNKDNDWIWG